MSTRSRTSTAPSGRPQGTGEVVSLLRKRDPGAMIDGFGRHVEYVRLSVTDRCDLRCRYCMSESMRFVPNADLLSFAELEQLTDALIERGVRKLRLTGGEPLVRRGIEQLIFALGSRIGRGLDELTMTTNGTQLRRYAPRWSRPASGASTSAWIPSTPTAFGI